MSQKLSKFSTSYALSHLKHTSSLKAVEPSDYLLFSAPKSLMLVPNAAKTLRREDRS